MNALVKAYEECDEDYDIEDWFVLDSSTNTLYVLDNYTLMSAASPEGRREIFTLLAPSHKLEHDGLETFSAAEMVEAAIRSPLVPKIRRFKARQKARTSHLIYFKDGDGIAFNTTTRKKMDITMKNAGFVDTKFQKVDFEDWEEARLAQPGACAVEHAGGAAAQLKPVPSRPQPPGCRAVGRPAPLPRRDTAP